jgi:hypothetical protein
MKGNHNPNTPIKHLINPPHLVRDRHPDTGSPIVRLATDTEIRRGRGVCFLPIYFKMANKWYLLTGKGAWAAMAVGPCRYQLLTNSNGDTLGIGIY